MKQYLTVLFCGSLLGAVCSAVAGARLEKYVRYLAALICILLIVSPFKEFDWTFLQDDTSHEISMPQANGTTLEELAAGQAGEEICRLLSLQLSQETGITPAELRIDMDWTEQEPTVTALHLTLAPEDDGMAEKIIAWAEAAYGIPCYVTKGEESS